MRRLLLLAGALLLSASTASAATKQNWTAGWDFFGEPLNYTKSNVQWSVSPSRKLTVTYNLVARHRASFIR